MSNANVVVQESVFCQLTGRDISHESCVRTQGQDGCFGCASSARICEVCHENLVVVAATGTCSACTQKAIEQELPFSMKGAPSKIECKFMRKPISSAACWTTQGQEECRGCASPVRYCETCNERHVRYPQYGLCFQCTISELGEGWTRETPDTPARRSGLVVDTKPQPAVDANEIRPVAQEFRRVLLANIRDSSMPLRRDGSDVQALSELGDSMASDGLISPVILEAVGDDVYEVLIGSRRVQAARNRGSDDIPALVLGPQDPLMKLTVMLAENLHRAQLDPIEEGRAFVRLMKEFGLDMASVAAKVKRPVSYITERIKLFSLPEDAKRLVTERKISRRGAASLASLPDDRTLVRLANESAEHRFAPQELRRHIKKELGEENHERMRVLPYRVTPQKLAARIDEFALWFQRTLPQLDLGEVTESEIAPVIEALGRLEVQTHALRERIQSDKSTSDTSSIVVK